MFIKLFVLNVALFASFNLLAQVECSPNTDFCFPENEPGNHVVVPSLRYPTIQFAIDQAPAGTTIRIRGGQYFENIVVNNKNINFAGNNPPGLPTIIDAENFSSPTFSILGSPTVKFKNINMKKGSLGIMTDFQQQGPLPKIYARDMVMHNLGRGIMGQFDILDITKSDISMSHHNALSIMKARVVSLKDSFFRLCSGYGMVILGSTGSSFFAQNIVVEGNTKGGIFALGVKDGLTLNRIRAVRNGGAGIILDHTGEAYVQRSELIENKRIDGKFGNGLLIYSSPVHIYNSNFYKNEGFQTGLVGCGTTGERFMTDFEGNAFTVNATTPPFTVFAMYGTPGCTSSPYGTISDGGRNFCNGTLSCKADSAGDLSPIPVDL